MSPQFGILSQSVTSEGVTRVEVGGLSGLSGLQGEEPKQQQQSQFSFMSKSVDPVKDGVGEDEGVKVERTRSRTQVMDSSVSSLRQLMNRQNDLSFKVLDNEKSIKTVASKPEVLAQSKPFPTRATSPEGVSGPLSPAAMTSPLVEMDRSAIWSAPSTSPPPSQPPPQSSVTQSKALQSGGHFWNRASRKNDVNNQGVMNNQGGISNQVGLNQGGVNHGGVNQGGMNHDWVQQGWGNQGGMNQAEMRPHQIFGPPPREHQGMPLMTQRGASRKENWRGGGVVNNKGAGTRRQPWQQSPVNQNNNMHPFHHDPQLNTVIPPWFIDCSREKAESILSFNGHHGNVLLRPSSTYMLDGKYVISFRSDSFHSGSQVHHFSVVRTNIGFVIDVENPHHPMSSLSEVMQFFVSVVPHTRLLVPSPPHDLHQGQGAFHHHQGPALMSPTSDWSAGRGPEPHWQIVR